MARNVIERTVRISRHRVLGKPARWLHALLGVEIPAAVRIGEGLTVPHRGVGLVVHPRTVIGDRVKLYQGVTIGRYDTYREIGESDFERVVIEDDVVVGAGAVVLGGPGETRLGRGSVVGANSVLTGSTGPGEIWAGAPARRVGTR